MAPTSLTLAVGADTSLVCQLTGVGATADRTIDWSSSDTTVVQVAKLLPPSGVLVVGRKPGSASVIAAWRGPPQIQGAALVTVR